MIRIIIVVIVIAIDLALLLLLLGSSITSCTTTMCSTRAAIAFLGTIGNLI